LKILQAFCWYGEIKIIGTSRMHYGDANNVALKIYDRSTAAARF
jgi:hypothetical protein